MAGADRQQGSILGWWPLALALIGGWLLYIAVVNDGGFKSKSVAVTVLAVSALGFGLQLVGHALKRLFATNKDDKPEP